MTINSDPPRTAIADSLAEKSVPAAERPAGERPGLSPWALLRRLHFYAGVFVAPFLVVAALTGLVYTLTPQLDRIVYGHELRVDRVGATALPLTEQVRAARQAHPQGALSSVTVSDDPHATTQVLFSTPELTADERGSTVYVDPYTGAVRGTLTTWYGATPLKTWLDGLHRNLQLGPLGRNYSELAASWLWVIVLGGLLLWLGRKRVYRGQRAARRRAVLPDLGARGVRRTRSWHASVGVWLVVGLVFLSATGLTWSNYAGAHFDSALSALHGHTPELDTGLPAASTGHHHSSSQPAADLPAGVSLDRVAAAANLSGPVTITLPTEAGTAYAVAQNDGTWPVRFDQVAVDPTTGQVTERVRFADWPLLAKLTKLGIRAHMGELFGVVNQVLLAALALGLLGVICWGYRMWWQRRPTRDGRRALVGSAPPRGGWLRIPTWLLLVGVPVTVLVGWALPLLGLTLVGFLVIDVLLGAVRQPGPATAPPR